MVHTLSIGRSFDSRSEVKQFMANYELEQQQKFSTANNKSIAKVCNKRDKPFNAALECDEIRYTCIRSGEFKTKGKGIRKRKSIKIGCPAFIKLRTTASKQQLVITAFHEGHNHGPMASPTLSAKVAKQVEAIHNSNDVGSAEHREIDCILALFRKNLCSSPAEHLNYQLEVMRVLLQFFEDNVESEPNEFMISVDGKVLAHERSYSLPELNISSELHDINSLCGRPITEEMLLGEDKDTDSEVPHFNSESSNSSAVKDSEFAEVIFERDENVARQSSLSTEYSNLSNDNNLIKSSTLVHKRRKISATSNVDVNANDINEHGFVEQQEKEIFLNSADIQSSQSGTEYSLFTSDKVSSASSCCVNTNEENCNTVLNDIEFPDTVPKGRPKGRRLRANGLPKKTEKCVSFAKKSLHTRQAQMMEYIGMGEALKNTSNGEGKINSSNVMDLNTGNIHDAVASKSFNVALLRKYFEPDAFILMKKITKNKKKTGPSSCGICKKRLRQKSIECNGCLQFHHYKCADVKTSSKSEDLWFCPECQG